MPTMTASHRVPTPAYDIHSALDLFVAGRHRPPDRCRLGPPPDEPAQRGGPSRLRLAADRGRRGESSLTPPRVPEPGRARGRSSGCGVEASSGERRDDPCLDWSAPVALDVPPAEWSNIRARRPVARQPRIAGFRMRRGFELTPTRSCPRPSSGPRLRAFACPPLRSKVQLYWLARCCASWAWASARAASASASFSATSR